MNYKPGDFFIGVIDFFAVILPGALLVFFIQAHWFDLFFGPDKIFPALHTPVEKGLVFIIATYILGNIIFLIASLIMDHLVYDRFLRNVCFKKNADLAYHSATQIKERYLRSPELIDNLLMQNKFSEKEKVWITSRQKKEVINTYKWIQQFMLLKHPEALIDIKKLEADSKFFRCLVITFLLIAVFSFLQSERTVGLLFLFLSLLSSYRYGDLRYKSTQRAYEFLITYYYLNHPVEASSAITNTHKLKEKINQETRAAAAAYTWYNEPSSAYHRLIIQLKSGLKKTTTQLTIPGGDTAPVFFTAQKEEIWYCLKGKGMLQVDQGNSHFLIPNATITIEKDKTYSFINKLQEPMELVVLKN